MHRYKDESDCEYKYHRSSPSRRRDDYYYEMNDREHLREEPKIRSKELHDKYQDSRQQKKNERFEQEKLRNVMRNETYHRDLPLDRIHAKRDKDLRKGSNHETKMYIHDELHEDDTEDYHSHFENDYGKRSGRRDREDRNDRSDNSEYYKYNERRKFYDDDDDDDDDDHYHRKKGMSRERKVEETLSYNASDREKSRVSPGSEYGTKTYIYETMKDAPIEASRRENHSRLSSNIARDDESRVSSRSNKSSNRKLKLNRLDAIDEYGSNNARKVNSSPVEMEIFKETDSRRDEKKDIHTYPKQRKPKENKTARRREHEKESSFHQNQRESKERMTHTKQYKSDRKYDNTESYERKEPKSHKGMSESTFADDHSISSSKRKGLGFLRIFKRKESEKDSCSDPEIKHDEKRSVSRQKKIYSRENSVDSDDLRYRERERGAYVDNVSNKRYVERDDRVRSRKSKSLGYDHHEEPSNIRVDDRYFERKHKLPKERRIERDHDIRNDDDTLQEDFEQIRIRSEKKKMPHYRDEMKTRNEPKLKEYQNMYDSQGINRFESHGKRRNFDKDKGNTHKTYVSNNVKDDAVLKFRDRDRVQKSEYIDGIKKRNYRRNHESLQDAYANRYSSYDRSDQKMSSSAQSPESVSSFESCSQSGNENASTRSISPSIKSRTHAKSTIKNDQQKYVDKRNRSKDDIPKSALSLAVLSDIKKGDISLKEAPTDNQKDQNNDILSQIRMGKKLNSSPRNLSPKPEKPMTILDEIKQGKQLKKAKPSSKDRCEESRDDALKEIRARRKRVANSKSRSCGYSSDEWT
jgi:hypothetical protein